MLGLDVVVDRLSIGAGAIRDVVRHHVPSDYWPDPGLVAAASLLVGLVLALWGGRLLRAFCVLTFMGIGAAVGIKIARIAEVDDLIGLVLGAGLAGLVGHLLYHWWVGITAGVCAMLVVALVLGVKYLPEIEAEIEAGTQAFNDRTHGVGTDVYTLLKPEPPDARKESIRAYLTGLVGHYWEARRDRVYRVGFVLALACLTGLGLGLTLPRFVTIVGTSVIGVLGLALGLGLLISMHWQGLWAVIVGHVAWSLAALGVVLVASLAYQARPRRLVAAPPPPVPSKVAVTKA